MTIDDEGARNGRDGAGWYLMPVLLAAVALVAIVVVLVLKLDDPDADLVPVSTIGGAAIGALCTLARRPPRR